MKTSAINPHVRYAAFSVLPPKFVIPKRIIYDYEIICLERGDLKLHYGGRDWHCAAGDILFLCPAIPHSFQIGETHLTQPHIHFDMTHRPESERIPVSFKDLPEMTELEKGWIHPNYFSDYPLNPILSIKNKEEFRALFFSIVRKGITDPLTAKGKLTQLIAIIIRDNYPDLFEEKPTAYPIVNQIKDYIDAGGGFQMDLDDFSKQFSYSKFYLEKRFKQAYGISLMEYRNNKRMAHAKKLLKTHSVSKTAEELGYKSIYSFSRAFKLYYGYAPTQMDTAENTAH